MRDPLAPIIEGFDCSGLVNRYSFQCEPFYTEGDNGGTLLDGSTVTDVLAAKVRVSWTLNSLSSAQRADLETALNSGESPDTVKAMFFDPTADAVRLARFHVTRPAFQFAFDCGRVMSVAGAVLSMEEASPIARFRVTPPDKLSYDIGEALDLSGLAVTAYDKDGAASDITAQCAVTPENGTPLLNPGAVPLSVSYDGFPVYAAAVTVADGEIIASGDWWTLYDRGLLYIYCVGDMPDFSSTATPWHSYKGDITNIVISDSVTSIGNNAFQSCTSLTSVTIPDSVTSIGDNAFNNCYKLVSVTIPDSVTSIGSRAFAYCSKLASVTIPDSVTSIGDNAFNNCYNLVSVTIPDSVTIIDINAFSYCSKLASVTMPDSVTSIGDNAFRNCSKLASVTIPDSVTSIGKWAFYDTALTSVTINRNCAVGSNAFPSGCVINYYN